jgi:D-glycero-D-manno-heptose 1,7-bisphosphate phosphatase
MLSTLRPAASDRSGLRLFSSGTDQGAPFSVRHVILDRDGVLNREPARGWVVDPAAWRWETGSAQALALLARAGVRVSVVTNQSCVGRGIAPPSAVDAVHQRMHEEATAAGGRFDRILVCPHVDADGCDCRKPLPGLLLRAVGESGIPAEQTVVIGDARRDLDAASAAGLSALLVRTGKGSATEQNLAAGSLPVFDHLYAAACWLVGDGR